MLFTKITKNQNDGSMFSEIYWYTVWECLCEGFKKNISYFAHP